MSSPWVDDSMQDSVLFLSPQIPKNPNKKPHVSAAHFNRHAHEWEVPKESTTHVSQTTVTIGATRK
eukprot:2472612-Amphidinium_carterae.1